MNQQQQTWQGYKSIQPYFICTLAAFFYVYDYFIQVSPSIMTEQLMRDLHTDAAGLGFLSACFFYSYVVMQIPAGILLDRFGARILLTLSVFVSACGVTLFGMADHIVIAGLARFLVGLGSAFAFISAIFLASSWFSHRYFAMIAGLVQLAGCLGSIMGEAPLALLINHLGWRETMLYTGFITFSLSVIYWLFIREKKAHQLTHSFTLKGEFARLKQVVSFPQMWWIFVCGIACWVPSATIGALWGVPYLMQVYHWDNVTAGYAISVFWLGVGLGSPFMGWYSSHIAQRVKPFVICFSFGLVASIVILFADRLPSYVILISLFFLGISAAVQSLSFGLVKDFMPKQYFGTASGFNNMAALIGGGISQPLVGILLAAEWSGTILNNVHVYTAADYQNAFLILPVFALIGLIISKYRLVETHCEIQPAAR